MACLEQQAKSTAPCIGSALVGCLVGISVSKVSHFHEGVLTADVTGHLLARWQ